jgi:hypothetical protein
MSSLAALCFLAACDSAPPPESTSRLAIQDPARFKEDFEKDNPKWKFAAGKWERRRSGDTTVLAQTAETQPWAVALLEDRRYADVDVTVRWKPISGKEDQTGGIIFRAKDAKNYYLVRANSLEDNFRLYTMTDGKRGQIASTKVEAPKVGQWHTMRVVAKGKKLQAYLDGKLLIDHEDANFAEGYVGLWTKADSVTEFDDLEIAGAPVK